MITEGIIVSILCNSLCVFPRTQHIPLTLEVYPDVAWPPRPAIREQTPRQQQPPKPASPKRTIIIPGYAPPLPVPANWRPKGKGWEIGP